jgi:hypothetical protein
MNLTDILPSGSDTEEQINIKNTVNMKHEKYFNRLVDCQGSIRQEDLKW